MGKFLHNWRRRRRYHKRTARHVADLGPGIPKRLAYQKEPVVLLTEYNESARLPAFFKWYRDLGVCRFIAIDNGSTDGSREWLEEQADTLILSTSASYAEAGHGTWWFNALLERMTAGQWVLTLDADECLAYEDMETCPLDAFTRRLEEAGCEAVFTPLIDMYPAGSISKSNLPSADSFLSIPNFFHPASEYLVLNRPNKRFPWLSSPDLRGGPRMDALDPESRPLLSKWALFRYRPGRFVAGSHSLFPASLMASSPSAALLHFKYSAGQMNYLQSVVEQQRHGAYHSDYEHYLEQYRQGCDLHLPGKSIEYRKFADLKPLLQRLQSARAEVSEEKTYRKLDTYPPQ